MLEEEFVPVELRCLNLALLAPLFGWATATFEIGVEESGAPFASGMYFDELLNALVILRGLRASRHVFEAYERRTFEFLGPTL